MKSGAKRRLKSAKPPRNPLWLEYGTRVRAALAALELSQSRAAKEIGIAPNTFNQYLQGVREFPPEIARRLFDTYRVTADWIYCNDPSGLRPEIRSKILAER